MPQVQKPTVDAFLELIKERYDNLVTILTQPDDNNVDVFYEIDLQKMYLARNDLISLLKLVEIG